MGCAGQRGPAIEGYLLELDDGCGGEFRVSKHYMYPEGIAPSSSPCPSTRIGTFSGSPANSSMTLHSSDLSSSFSFFPRRCPTPAVSSPRFPPRHPPRRRYGLIRQWNGGTVRRSVVELFCDPTVGRHRDSAGSRYK